MPKFTPVPLIPLSPLPLPHIDHFDSLLKSTTMAAATASSSQEDEDHRNVYNPDDLDDNDEDDDEEPDPTDNMINPSENDAVVDEDEDDYVDVDVDVDDDVDDSTSSSNLAAAAAHRRHNPDPSLLNHHLPPPPSAAVSGAGEVTVAIPSDHPLLPPDLKRQRIHEVTVAPAVGSVAVEEKKPVPADDSRRLFQRLWTDEDEIELLQGFLEYTTSRGPINSSHHHDTTAFYDQIKSKLQLDCNKNQLVEKLRRLKKKYRNVVNKMESGKEYVFKSPHDQATFEISRKIWSGSGVTVAVRGDGVMLEEGGFDDDEANHNFSVNFIDQSPNPNLNHNPNGVDSFEKKTPRSRKRSRGGGVKIEEKQFGFNSVPNFQHFNQQQNVQNVSSGVSNQQQNVQNVSSGMGGITPTAPPVGVVTAEAASGSGPVTNLIEETVRSCLSPIFKELLNSVTSMNGMNGSIGGSKGFGFALSPMPLGLNGDMLADEKWRKQQILELEVYSKRLELVQDQIKTQLEELRSMGN